MSNSDTEQPFHRSNKEVAAEWAIDVDRDPYDIPLDEIDPSHPDIFVAKKELTYFERLRAEDPVHLTPVSPTGPYWSITKYDDILAIDSDFKRFSSDIRNGGIRLGQQALEGEPDPLTYLPMFIQEDPPQTR